MLFLFSFVIKTFNSNLKVVPNSKLGKTIFESGVSIVESDLPIGINFFRFFSFFIFSTASYSPFAVSEATGDRFNIFATERAFTLIFIIVIVEKTAIFKAPLINNQFSVGITGRIFTPS